MSERPRTYLVECYWPGIDAKALASAERRVRETSVELGSDPGQAVFLGSVLVPADETVFCFFEGREADVRAACVRAEIPFERVLEAGPVEIRSHAKGGS